jgi:hypothetical protein
MLYFKQKIKKKKKVALFPYHPGNRLIEDLEANCQDFHALALYERQRLQVPSLPGCFTVGEEPSACTM